MRLIDADKLINKIAELFRNDDLYLVGKFIGLISQQSTEFDVNKIEKELRSLKQYDNKYDSYYDHTMYMMTDLQNKIVNRTIDKVLEIVKRGGIDD